jgi:hypothetical protein
MPTVTFTELDYLQDIDRILWVIAGLLVVTIVTTVLNKCF